MKYKLITSVSNAGLNEAVNSYLQNGWFLYGNPMCTENSYSQAVVDISEELEFAQGKGLNLSPVLDPRNVTIQ